MSKRFDIVGSLLRPTELLTYKRQIEERADINYPFYADFDGYEAVEKTAINRIVEQQIKENIHTISDGEFSKSVWHLDFLWGLAGIERFIVKKALEFKDEAGNKAFEIRRDSGIRVTSELSGKNHHFIDVYKRIKAASPEGQRIKICIPAPSHVYFDFNWNPSMSYTDVYANSAELKAALMNAYKQFITDYAEAGGIIIQFDDCRWAMFADDNESSPFFGNDDFDTAALAHEFIAYNNELIAFSKGLGLTVWTHNCRGNYRSRHLSTGAYEKISDLFLGGQNYDRFFLEWDDERAGSLEALEIFKNKEVEVVVGLLSSKTSTLEDEAKILKSLEEASTLINKERLFLSHQCGFASSDHGNELTEAQQWDKIRQGQAIALKFWGE